MGMLTRAEIERRLAQGQLLRNARMREGQQFDIEADSYDLAAGTVIWKQPSRKRRRGRIATTSYDENVPGTGQPTVTVEPGQMVFVVTREDVLMPLDLCGTVYSRNRLALDGILALNAGHVDPGYEGPIAIRLINLRAIPWTLTLGEPIFTITFQTIDVDTARPTGDYRHISQEQMIMRVRGTADAALSNALYDLYATEIEIRLNEYKANALAEFRQSGDEWWIRRDRIWPVLLGSLWSKIFAGIIILGALAAIAAGIVTVLGFLGVKL